MKYPIAFLVIGGLSSYTAVILGGWWHVSHWFSLSFVLLAAGHAGFGPRVFGKRPDGRIPLWSKVLHLPYMIFAGCVWRLVRLLSRERPADTVCDDLILSRRLLASEVPPDVTNYIDLTAETEDPTTVRDLPGYINVPVLDAMAPSPELVRSAIARLAPGVTLVHCAQGHGRTGAFALALLAERGRIRTLEEGMSLITAARSGVRLNTAQKKFARTYIENTIAT